MAEAFQVPVAPHDCTGPVLLTASVHHSLNASNALVQEIVRAFYYGCYQDLVTDLPPIEDGHIRAPDGPGLGLVLQPDVLKRADCQVMRTAL
jgi:L-alanine-DL-glutamate epimerase-like enolase superfamily enzyme